MRCFLYVGYGFPSPAARFSHDSNMDRANATDDTSPMPYAKGLEKVAKPDLPKAIAAVRKVMYLD